MPAAVFALYPITPFSSLFYFSGIPLSVYKELQS